MKNATNSPKDKFNKLYAMVRIGVVTKFDSLKKNGNNKKFGFMVQIYNVLE